MRLIVYGAGAVGGVVGGKLQLAGEGAILIARGRHLEAMRSRGLELEEPGGCCTVPVTAVGHPSEVDWRPDDVVLLSTKSQDTAAALTELSGCAPRTISIVCLQNGVENERLALRRFPNVYGCVVMVPAVHLEPGKVQCYAAAPSGILDLGRYPRGNDHRARAVAAALARAGFSSRALEDVMPSKYAKLLLNLGNAVEALCGTQAGTEELNRRAKAEANSVLEAAGIQVSTDPQDATRRAGEIGFGQIDGHRHLGSSTWQSLQRRASAVEADYLNGEIVLLGRLHGQPAPVNEALARLVDELARAGAAPGTISPESVLAAVTAAGD